MPSGGYTQRQREEAEAYVPPWVEQHRREGWYGS